MNQRTLAMAAAIPELKNLPTPTTHTTLLYHITTGVIVACKARVPFKKYTKTNIIISNYDNYYEEIFRGMV